MSERDDMRARLEQSLSQLEVPILGAQIVCVGCGCTDTRACEGGCFWAAAIDGKGICSNCIGIPIEKLAARRASA